MMQVITVLCIRQDPQKRMRMHPWIRDKWVVFHMPAHNSRGEWREPQENMSKEQLCSQRVMRGGTPRPPNRLFPKSGECGPGTQQATSVHRDLLLHPSPRNLFPFSLFHLVVSFSFKPVSQFSSAFLQNLPFELHPHCAQSLSSSSRS